MGTADQVHIVFLEKAGDNVGTEREADTAIIFTPTSDVLIGIRPEEIAEQAAVRDLRSIVSTNNLNRSSSRKIGEGQGGRDEE